MDQIPEDLVVRSLEVAFREPTVFASRRTSVGLHALKV